MKIKIVVTAEVFDQAGAEKVRDEIAGSLQDAKDSNELPFLDFDVGDPVELETDRIAQVAAAARQRHCDDSDDEIEIDSDAILSEGEDGPWIQAWLFVPKSEVPTPNEESEEVDG